MHASFTTTVALAVNLASAAFTMRSFTFTDIVSPWAVEVQTSTPSGIMEVWTINQPPEQGGASDGSDLVGGAPASAYNTSQPGAWLPPQPTAAAPGFNAARRSTVAEPARR